MPTNVALVVPPTVPGGVTVTVACLVTYPWVLAAVNVKVVVADGVTVRDPVVGTAPMS
jgi:hypothetical protein